MKPRLYLDMDDTIFDFSGDSRIPEAERGRWEHPEYFKQFFFLNLKPLPGALESIRQLIAENKFDIYILTKPLVENLWSFTEKQAQIKIHLPTLERHVIMTQNKHLLREGILIDDNLEWKNFEGKFIHFDPKNSEAEWKRILKLLETL